MAIKIKRAVQQVGFVHEDEYIDPRILEIRALGLGVSVRLSGIGRLLQNLKKGINKTAAYTASKTA